MDTTQMHFEQKRQINNLVRNQLLLANRVYQEADGAKSFSQNCRKMGLQVYQLSQMLNTLLLFINLDPIFSYFHPIHSVIIEVSKTLHQSLTLACTCKRKATFRRLFSTGRKANNFHKLYHLLDVSIANMNWILVLYNPNFGCAFNEIFLFLPPILINDPSILLAGSSMITQKMIWELTNMLAGETSPIELKICCVKALLMLKVGKVLNNRMIKEAKLLMLGLAKSVEGGHGELQSSYLMTIVEVP